jgi:hypothetical protein
LCNPPGIAHGGRTPTLIDSAAGCAGHVAEVHAGTPKSQTLANYPREFWQPSTRCPVILCSAIDRFLSLKKYHRPLILKGFLIAF